MATNKLTEVAGLVAQAVMGAKVKDKDGNAKTVKPTGDDNLLDLTDIGAFGGGSGGTDIDKEHPSAGADYYAGSLADGEITERYLLYQRDESVAEQTGSQTVTLLRDVGSMFNMGGDGATFLIHLQRTAMTKGAKGAVTDIELNYDPNNVAKDGYFTTTSPYPIYIKASDLATKKTLAIPINGIGENLSGKNVKAPQLNVTFNGNGTMTFGSVTGYDNDGDSAGATGANYDVVVDVIATFSTQPAVAQFPASINFFTGQATGEIALTGISDFYENPMDGLNIFFDTYSYNYFKETMIDGRVNSSDLGMKTSVTIPKEKLIIGYNFKIPYNPWPSTIKPIHWWDYTKEGYNDHETGGSIPRTPDTSKNGQSNILIKKGSITINYSRFLDAANKTEEYFDLVDKVTPYKN